MNEELCNERHEYINKALDRIEAKVDRLLWKFLAYAIALIGIVLGGLRLIK